MIAFGSCVGCEERFARYAEPGIRLAAGSEALVLKRREQESIFAAYNSILAEAQDLPRLQALVLLHDDTEIQDPELTRKLQRLFSDHSIGLAGVVGASGVTSLAWWEAERRGRVSWNGPRGSGPKVDDFGMRNADVDCVDGLMLALSPWTVRNVRFDEGFTGFHGYDVDFAFSVREAGKRVVVTDLALHHHDRRAFGFADRPGFLRVNVRWRAKWGFDSRAMVPLRLASIAVRSSASGALGKLRSKR